jgi:hypothetical protein
MVPIDQVQAIVNQAVAAAVAAQGPVAPDGVAQDPPKAPILTALAEMEAEGLHSTFAERVEELARTGYETVISMEQERPALRTLLSIVGDLVEKAKPAIEVAAAAGEEVVA